MKTVNMHEAKTHLSRLVREAADGEPFVIARAGKPLVKVVPLDDPAGPAAKPPKRTGFYSGLSLPDDFDIKAIMADEIEEMFYGGPLFPDETAP